MLPIVNPIIDRSIDHDIRIHAFIVSEQANILTDTRINIYRKRMNKRMNIPSRSK